MKILVVCQYYYPEQFKINEICEELVTKGHHVTVLTGLPNYPEGYVLNEYRKNKKRKEIINGVNVIRSFEIGRKNSSIFLGLNYISYMLSASVKSVFMKKDFDVIYVYQLSPVTMALPGVIVKKLTKTPIHLYCCDIWPESMKIIIKNEESLTFRIIKRLSKYLYTNCDSIAVTSKPFIDYFETVHSIPKERISYIPQHSDEIIIEEKTNNKDGTTNFMFMGNIGKVQDVDCILMAANEIKESSNFMVHFVGDGSYLEESKRIVRELGLDDIVIFHGRHPIESMPEFYKIADACLLTLKSDSLVGLTIPSKLQGYMSAGKPVIGAIDGAAQEVIKQSECGLCVDSGDYEGLANAMKDFVDNPSKYKSAGINAEKYFRENFTREVYISSLEKEFEKIKW